MNYDTFKASVSSDDMPDNLNQGLQALWQEAKGNWEASHDIVNDMPNALGSWIHAYLHRVEGDLSNAAYWYRKAERPVCEDSLESEWENIAKDIISA